MSAGEDVHGVGLGQSSLDGLGDDGILRRGGCLLIERDPSSPRLGVRVGGIGFVDGALVRAVAAGAYARAMAP